MLEIYHPLNKPALDLDMLIAARTAPQNSFRNPVERIMSILNIGLQAVGVMREEMTAEFENCLKSQGCPQKKQLEREFYFLGICTDRVNVQHFQAIGIEGEIF
jgi:hypothetical protein